MLPLGKTESLKSVLIATRRLLFDEVSKHLSLRLAEGLARRAETILNSHGECRLESGRRCLPMFDCGNRPARKLIFVWAIPRFMSRLATCVTKPLMSLLARLPAVLGLMTFSAAVCAFHIPAIARWYVARLLLSRSTGCSPIGVAALTSSTWPTNKSSSCPAPCWCVAFGSHERQDLHLFRNLLLLKEGYGNRLRPIFKGIPVRVVLG